MPPRVERRWLDLVGMLARLPAGTTREKIELGGMPATVTAGPWAQPGRAFLYLHGGAYVAGSPAAYKGFIAALSAAARAAVYCPDYPLAPEHPYPAAPDAALAAFRALRGRGGEGAVAVGGDSAGGGLTLGLALRLRDAGEALPAGLVLLCPWVDLANAGESFRANGPHEPILDAERSNRNARQYAAGAALDDPRLSPLYADDLTGLPPIHMQGATDDLHLSDAEQLAARLRLAGAKLEYRRFDGVFHDFQLFGDYLADAREAVAAAGSALEGFFSSVAAGGAVEAATQG